MPFLRIDATTSGGHKTTLDLGQLRAVDGKKKSLGMNLNINTLKAIGALGRLGEDKDFWRALGQQQIGDSSYPLSSRVQVSTRIGRLSEHGEVEVLRATSSSLTQPAEGDLEGAFVLLLPKKTGASRSKQHRGSDEAKGTISLRLLQLGSNMQIRDGEECCPDFDLGEMLQSALKTIGRKVLSPKEFHAIKQHDDITYIVRGDGTDAPDADHHMRWKLPQVKVVLKSAKTSDASAPAAAPSTACAPKRKRDVGSPVLSPAHGARPHSRAALTRASGTGKTAGSNVTQVSVC